MTEKELLEFAAKAAGIRKSYIRADRDGWWGDQSWDPLTDDGDAFRLAVKLGMLVNVCLDDDEPCNESYAAANPYVERVKHGADAAAATRMAIVRVAAALGKELK